MGEWQQPGTSAQRDCLLLAVILFTALSAVAIPIAILIWILRPLLR
jgi:hypothetical protein